MAKCYSSDKESKSTDQVSTLAFKAAKMIRYSCLGKFIATKKTSNFFLLYCQQLVHAHIR